jgi:hypothetical protein
MNPKVLVAVLACDYGNTNHENGPHVLTRLDKALEEFAGRTDDVLFIFSAGRLAPENSRLCDLQAEYVRARGFRAQVPPEDGALIWGSKAELHFLRLQQQLYPAAQVVVVSEDYHVDRMELLARRKIGLVNATFIKASSVETPPSFRAVLHEKLGLVEPYVPNWVMAGPKLVRRVTLRHRLINY